MSFKIQTWEETNARELAEFIYAHGPKIEPPQLAATAESIYKMLKDNFAGDQSRLILSRQKDESLNGAVLLFPGSRTSIKINPGQVLGGLPIVAQDAPEDLAEKLFATARLYAAQKEYTSLKLNLISHQTTPPEAAHRWCLAQGMTPGMSYAEMTCPLPDKYAPVTLPEGLSIQPLEDADQEELVNLFTHTFAGSDARYFDDMTESELESYFDMLGYEDARQQRGSFVFRVGAEKLAGFSMVLSFEPRVQYISCMLIHPDHQGQGLGRLMLKLIKQYAVEDGFTQLSLGTEPEMAAYALYHKHGFEPVNTGFQYVVDLNEAV